MSLNAAQIEAYVDAAAAAIALPLAPEHRPGVLRYFTLAAGLAELVNGLPLGPADEPAGAFLPIEPEPSATRPMSAEPNAARPGTDIEAPR
jgi:hypothetical protein